MRVALVNTNRIRPPVSPIGLEYVAEALLAAGHEVSVLDLCWEEAPDRAIRDFFAAREYELVGMTIRNTDDCSFATRESFLPGCARIVETIRNHSAAPVVAGGVGFSVMPEAAIAVTGADAGVVGDGEFTLAAVADRIRRRERWEDLPNIVVSRNGAFRRNHPSSFPLSRLPPMSRSLVDNRRYCREGGQAGIETKRGCPLRAGDEEDKIHHIKSRPHHPMTLGKIERFWKTIYVEFLSRAQFGSFEDAGERIRQWVKYYNHKRPHQGIGGLCPADRYFEIQSELRMTIEQGIQDNLLEMALRGKPRLPFYMVGRMEGQSGVLRAEKGRLRLSVEAENDDITQEVVYNLNDEGENYGEDREDKGREKAAGNELWGSGEMQGGTVGVDGEAETA